ncbi:BnaCnng04960D [Brassica napus]|uniref:BnaCnng04960D protein n=1 Tax=Brassica napus TaxID=3708 RepID=A0A078GGG7_BRANA|nr:BnaCnng04960D [Brassica napus]
MVDSSIQSEPGDLDDDSTTEAQPQIDGTGSESSQSLVTIKAVTASPISSSPAAKDGDEEAPSTVTHVLMTSSPALAPAETNTALVSSGEPPPSRAGSLEHGVTDSVYEVNTLVSVGIEPASPTATNPPPPISTSQQKEVVAHGAPTTTLQENTAQPPPIQVGPSDAWNSKESLSLPEITLIPLWVTLKNIPAQLYSIFALEWIASGLGELMLSHKPWLDPTMLGEAKVLVEIELDKPFPQKVAAWDKQGNYSMIDVEYTWLPSKCEKCGHLGHKAKRCLSTSQQTTPAKDHVLVVVDVSASPTSVGASSPKVNAISHPSMDQVKAADEPSSCQVDSFVKSAAVEVDFSPVVSGFNTTIVSSSPTIDMSSLASITLLENMCTSPSIICINDTIETPTQEPAQHHSATTTSPEIYTSTSNGACLDEPDLGSNKFASLLNVEEDEEDILEFDNDSEPMDYMSPFGKRILRERPVKPTTKAKEMHSQSTSRGRGSRGRSRGNRGRRG